MSNKMTETPSYADTLKAKAQQRKTEAQNEALTIQKVVRPKSENTEQMNVRVSADLLARLDIAVATNRTRGKRTRNAFVIEALEEWLERHEVSK